MRILFITATRIGDAILSTGLLDHLVRSHPDARITVVCGPAAAGLFEAAPNIERLIVMDKMLFSLHWLRMWGLTVGTLWDLVVDLRNAPLSYLLPARRQRHLGKVTADRHRIMGLSRVLGLEATPPPPKLTCNEAHRAQAQALIPEGSPVLAIGPTANWAAKTWSPDGFAELTARIGAADGMLPGCRVALFGRDDERPQAISLIEAIPAARRIDLIGRLRLAEVYACLQRCSFYVGNDSGLMHLAAAAGIPTLGLFGPSKELLYGPWGDHCASVRTPEGFDDIHPAEFDHRTSGSLMNSLTVDHVEAAARALWQKTQAKAA
ncbi:MAG: glycosyltransferase family 9 protein [Rhodospirillales bacterium]|nr:glycosyltransferase family 9 protein [Rhodospirillales bacterium]